ncbi:MAG: zinc-ribbon domain-containing protein, partial [Gemmataceae bacterium]|nr:zinc-ribbon domain-containing protein [Gemmataceae bacterium]
MIPAPVALRAEEIESVAVSVLTDEPGAAVIQTEAAIAMHCDYCGHEWQEPRSKAGKNVLCPECRQRLRVPEPKGKEASDWRNAHTRLPSLARQNQEKLDGVIDASEVQLVSGQALAQAGVTEVELEPRPLREKLLIAGLVVGVVALIAGSTYYLLHRRQVQKGEELLVQAQTYWQEGADDLSSVEATLGKALLYLILAEEAFHWENPDKFKQAYALLQKSRQELRNAPASPLRHALALEGSFLTLRFGGDASQVAAQTRLPWLPDSGGRAALLRTERIRTVHEELRLWLSLLQGADYDLRLAGARRLGRYLLDHDQWELALDGLPLMLFQDNERHDIRAQLALEAHLLGKGNERLSRLARELLPEFSSGGKEGAPAPSPAVLVLWQVTAVEKAPPLPPLPPQGTLPEALRYGHVLHLNLQGDTTSALNVAQRGGPVESQLKALLLGTECCCLRQQGQVADWLTAAATLVSSSKGKPNVRFADGQLFRFGQLA